MFVHIFIHTQRHVSVPRIGQIEKTVCCERCSCQYGYVTYRRAVARGTYQIWGGKDKAINEASRKAALKVQKLLARAIEPVPCPGCGWVQSAMVRDVRERFGQWMIGAGVIALAIFLAAAAVIYLDSINRPMRAGTRTLIADAIVLGVALCAGLIAARYALSFLIDPNGTYRTDRLNIPGSPIGYRIGERAAGGKSTVQTLSEERSGRATVQLAAVRFPAQCCHCLIETSTVKPMRCGSSAKIDLPICFTCLRRAKTAKILLTVCGSIVGFAAGCVGAFYLPPGENEVILPLAFGGAAFGAALGVMIARLFRVVKFSRFDSERNVVRIDFKNHQYASLLLEKGRIV